MKNNKKGFTLAELTISLAILGIIASGLMLLTAATVNKTYNRRVKYMFKNECQSVANCFSISDLYLDSSKLSGSEDRLNLTSLIDCLEFYFADGVTVAEFVEYGLPENTFSPQVSAISGKVTLSWTYDVSFKQTESNQYTFSLLIEYGDNSSLAYNPTELSMYICKGTEVITTTDMAVDNNKVVYSQVHCLMKEVPTE